MYDQLPPVVNFRNDSHKFLKKDIPFIQLKL